MDEDTINQVQRSSEEEETKKKTKTRGGGGCSGGSSSGQSSSSSASSASSDGSSSSSGGGLTTGDTDESVNSMCKKTYTVYRAIPKISSCPTALRDNLSDQFTPQDDLLVMEKTTRDFLKLESKIYDAESTNPRFFASEDWTQHYEKDKNIVLATMDQFKANILKMQHLYTVVDNNSYSYLQMIPNQDNKSSFQVNVMWTARALKDWANNWFINRTPVCCTKLHCKDYWTPSLTGQMIQWMKLGIYVEACQIRPISNEKMIEKVDRLEAWIDRLMNQSAVNQTISKYVNLKETLEDKAKQTDEQTFTTKIIDSQMGKKLGVSSSGTENDKEGSTYIAPKTDNVEQVNLVCKLSCVKSLFQTMRQLSLIAMKTPKCIAPCGPGPFPLIWTNISVLATKVYNDLGYLNTLIQDLRNDFENGGKHCSITHSKLCPKRLAMKITAFQCIIMKGVTDVMVNQALLPKTGLNILDSMFNQMWEYGEKGPLIELPSWCQQAIDSINGFEDSMIDAWDEVYDCWEREFLTRLWRIELEHHTYNHIKQQTVRVYTHHYPDTTALHISPLKGYLCCTNHLNLLLKPICVCYRVKDIAKLSKDYRPDVKELCQWMVSAIEAIGIKQAAISAVMSDPSMNGNCANMAYLAQINELRTKNDELLKKVEKAYAIYSDVNNMKNKRDYDDEIALQELQTNKYSNEDQLNMTSSTQSESNQNDLSAELCTGGIMKELQPWNHLNLSVDKVEPKCLPVTCACNKFDKIVSTAASFETMYGASDSSTDSSSSDSDSSSSSSSVTDAISGVSDAVGGLTESSSGSSSSSGSQSTLGQAGATAGGAAGQAIGTTYGGPIGGMVGKYVGEKVGAAAGEKVNSMVNS